MRYNFLTLPAIVIHSFILGNKSRKMHTKLALDYSLMLTIILQNSRNVSCGYCYQYSTRLTAIVPFEIRILHNEIFNHFYCGLCIIVGGEHLVRAC